MTGRDNARPARVARIVEAQQRESAEKHAATLKAIDDLVKRSAAISVVAVADAAGVSRGFIYQHKDLAIAIAALRGTRSSIPSDLTALSDAAQRSTTVQALRLELRRLKERHAEEVRTLKAENQTLRAQIETLLGRLSEAGR